MSEREGVWMSLSRSIKEWVRRHILTKICCCRDKALNFYQTRPCHLEKEICTGKLRMHHFAPAAFASEGSVISNWHMFFLCVCAFLQKMLCIECRICSLSNSWFFYYFLDQMNLIQICWIHGASNDPLDFWIFYWEHPGLFCVRCQRHNYPFSLKGPFSERRT